MESEEQASADVSADNDANGWADVPELEPIIETLEISSFEVAAHVTHSTRGRLLRRLRTPLSAAELAEELEVPVTRLYHHLNQLEEARLIRLVATRRVGAATERRYQAAAKSFTVPESVLEGSSLEEMTQLVAPLFDMAKLDFMEFVERGGMARADLEQHIALSLAQINLTSEQRREFVAELGALFERFQREGHDRGTAGTESFELFVVAFPPEADSSTADS